MQKLSPSYMLTTCFYLLFGTTLIGRVLGQERTFQSTLFDLDPNMVADQVDEVVSHAAKDIKLQELPIQVTTARATNAPSKPSKTVNKPTVVPRAKVYSYESELHRRVTQFPEIVQSVTVSGLRTTNSEMPVVKPPSEPLDNNSVFQGSPPLSSTSAQSAVLRAPSSPENTPNFSRSPVQVINRESSGNRFSRPQHWFDDTWPLSIFQYSNSFQNNLKYPILYETDCSRNSHEIASQFRHKFPANLGRYGKDKELSQLVEKYLLECDKKIQTDYWTQLETILSTNQLTPSEIAECEDGLVQELLACLNLKSFTCQFVQRFFAFRLIPARVIVQEARFIQDGDYKCRKARRLFEKQNQSNKY